MKLGQVASKRFEMRPAGIIAGQLKRIKPEFPGVGSKEISYSLTS